MVNLESIEEKYSRSSHLAIPDRILVDLGDDDDDDDEDDEFGD